ncbi:MAG: hypothetical protein WEC75_08410 [Dehalococcoidia bacterium]
MVPNCWRLLLELALLPAAGFQALLQAFTADAAVQAVGLSTAEREALNAFAHDEHYLEENRVRWLYEFGDGWVAVHREDITFGRDLETLMAKVKAGGVPLDSVVIDRLDPFVQS